MSGMLAQTITSAVSGQMSLSDYMQVAESLPVHWVSTQEKLRDLVSELRQCERVALDTEFIKRDTYYPRLALIQMNTGKGIYLLDAPKLDLSEFWAALVDIRVMIWHACGEDLGIFYLLSGCPPLTNIFDTQIALSYLTGQLQMGYQQAVRETLNIELAKEQSQSDWLARPLSQEQEQYAVDDVRYLSPLFLSLEQSLVEKGLGEQVREECLLYAHEVHEAQHIEDDAVYLRMADFRYTGQQMAVLQAVSAWREALARATNQPRTFILKKQVVRDIVTELPRSMKELANKTSIHRSVLRLYGDELLKVIQEAKQLPAAEQPARILPPYRSKTKIVAKAVQELVSEYAEQVKLPENVILRKRWLSELYKMVALDMPMDKAHLPMGLQGWRYEWTVQRLIPTLKAHKEELREGMELAD